MGSHGNPQGKFLRSRRILPCEQILNKVDNNNVLMQKDKGRGIKKEIKGFKFQEANGAADVLKAEVNPGPGHYSTGGEAATTKMGVKAPCYSIPSTGIVKMRKNNMHR